MKIDRWGMGEGDRLIIFFFFAHCLCVIYFSGQALFALFFVQLHELPFVFPTGWACNLTLFMSRDFSVLHDVAKTTCARKTT